MAVPAVLPRARDAPPALASPGLAMAAGTGAGRCCTQTALCAAVLRATTEYAVIGTGLAGTITVFNAGAERLLGYRAEEVLGRATPLPFHDPAEVAARANELGTAAGFGVFVHAARHGEPETHSWTYVRKDGSRVPVVLTVTPMLDEGADDGAEGGADGVAQPIGYLGVARDVTAELELERQKDEFLANISHDLRTPVSAIKASVGVVLSNEPPGMAEALHRMLANIDQAADRMTALVNDLLELARFRAGRTALDLRHTDLRTIAQRASQTVEPLALTRAQRLEVSLPAVEVVVSVDRSRLERALTNLLGNAQRHGREGGLIRLTLETVGGEAVFAVRDDGPGIHPADHERIFQRFQRGEAAPSRPAQGSGLGLPIARAMVEAHGGRVWVESKGDGGGATFKVALPLTGCGHTPAPLPAAA